MTNGFRQSTSEEIWKKKYQWNNETRYEMNERIAKALSYTDADYESIKRLMDEFKLSLGGRGLFTIGTDRRNSTSSSCFVQPIYSDSMEGIMDAAKDAALTQKAGGGVGYNFSILRPSTCQIQSSKVNSTGPVSFMKIFDATCETIKAGGARRGAQMGVMGIWHPDIKEFITAKSKSQLSNFNISVFVPDEFMEALKDDKDWDLVFPDTTYQDYNQMWTWDKFGGNIRKWKESGRPVIVYETIKARELWAMIMKNTYDFAEPGILFEDTINEENNLSYCEWILTSNPCGEQPLNNFSSCNLAPINLAEFVVNPFEDGCYFNFEKFGETVRTTVRMLDKMLDVNYLPLPTQMVEVQNKRAIGAGVMGVGSMLAMLRIKYGSSESIRLVTDIMETLRNISYEASVELAKEYGAFPLYDERFLQSPFVKRLPDSLQEKIAEHGIRNSRLVSIAPTGTTSFVYNYTSGGIEPIFALEATRKVLKPDGTHDYMVVRDYAWQLYNDKFGHTLPENAPDYFITTADLTVKDHLAIQACAQKYVDSAISKTVNIPTDYPFEEFKEVYQKAWESGCKGIATYRENPLRPGILMTKPVEEPKPQSIEVDPVEIEMKGPRAGITYDMTGKDGEKFYATVTVDNSGTPRELLLVLPREIGGKGVDFRQDNFNERFSDLNFIARLISLCLRCNVPVERIIDMADKAKFNMFNFAAQISRILGDFIPEDRTVSNPCPQCGAQIVKSSGCEYCSECDYSKCNG
jgi:ribonucleoside-diphosphate reductase alpha chain